MKPPIMNHATVSAWVKNKPDDAEVGYTGFCEQCPLAAMGRELGFYRVIVTGGGISFFAEQDAPYPSCGGHTTKFQQLFIRKVDALGRRQPVTAGQVKAILKGMA